MSTSTTRRTAAALLMLTVTALVLVVANVGSSKGATTFLQSADDERIIARLPPGSGVLAALSRAGGEALAPDADMARKASDDALAIFRQTGNTRYLAVARSLLQPWWEVSDPPPDIWLLRGRIKQTEHHFEAAARDLAALNQRHPRSMEARLLEADSWRRAGDLDRARKACFSVALQGASTLAAICGADILLSRGRPAAALDLIASQNGIATLDPAVRHWAMAIQADALVAAGRRQEAAQLWQAIARQGPMPLASRLAYADVLLSLGRPARVLTLLAQPATSAELLRYTVAATRLNRPEATVLNKKLQAHLALLAQAPEGHLHLREQALYALWMDKDAESALQLARRNWSLQKGWEDTELLLLIARQLKDTATLQTVEQWRQSLNRGGPV